MSKRTNKLYNVTVCKYAHMAVEADTPQEAMELAKKYKDDHITDNDFEDSEIGVDCCNAYSEEIEDMYLDDEEKVYTKDGVMTCEEYCDQLNEED